ncbi:MAG: hypothetical protein NUV77_11365 [Thermoguttaceae bacterium]|jgi:hypothetical protein|nr:hypothetical protein [Thermoguttaceae bacterium]
MTDFQQRLDKAIERGQRASDARARAEAQRALNEQELRRLHTQYRLQLADHIDQCLQQVARRLPGFQFEPVVSERGWGAAVSRDDLELAPRHRPTTRFSRFEVIIRPMTEAYVLEIVAKATVRNKELFNRTHYQRLGEADLTSFTELIDLWVLEFAERYAAKS